MATLAPIICSLLDTDLYKFSMWQSFLHSFPGNRAVYRFVCRNRPQFPLAQLRDEVEAQIEHLCSLRFTEEELAYLGSKRYLKSDFIDFLRIFHFQRRYIEVGVEGDDLTVVAQGPQIHVMGFEIYVLAIVSELYNRRLGTSQTRLEGRLRLREKVRMLEAFGAEGPRLQHPFSISDFGTRRRFARDWQEEVLATLCRSEPQFFKGSSNVYFAWKLGTTAMGTMAHEYVQTFQAVGIQLRHFQKAALEHWVQEYRGDLGVALTDTVGMDAFIDDFDLYFAKLFDGLRHDSGDPIEWGEKALKHYERLRIDPHTKRFVFSDALDIPKAISLYQHFGDRVQCAFGIGTNLTNDVGITPLNIVMKLVECNDQPVAKLSDSPGKTMCANETFLAYLRQVFNRAS